MNEFQLDSPCAFVIVNEALKLNKKQEKKTKRKHTKVIREFHKFIAL